MHECSMISITIVHKLIILCKSHKTEVTITIFIYFDFNINLTYFIEYFKTY